MHSHVLYYGLLTHSHGMILLCYITLLTYWLANCHSARIVALSSYEHFLVPCYTYMYTCVYNVCLTTLVNYTIMRESVLVVSLICPRNVWFICSSVYACTCTCPCTCSCTCKFMLQILYTVAAMKFNENLRELWLGANHLGPEDGQHLGSILRSNHTLRVLDVRENSLQVGPFSTGWWTCIHVSHK